MGQPAARVGDLHVCPMVTPGLPPVPHVGGPILPPGMPTVLIGGLPAATVGDMCVCVGPPDSIIKGSFTVLIGGRPAARMGDSTVHGGVITLGCPNVLIGDFGMGGIAALVALPPLVLAQFMSGMSAPMARIMKQAIANANGSPAASRIASTPLADVSVPPPCAYLSKADTVEASKTDFDRIRKPATLSAPKAIKHKFPGDTAEQDALEYEVEIDGKKKKLIMPKNAPPGKRKALPTAQQVADAMGAVPGPQLDKMDQVEISPNPNPEDAYWAKEYNDPDFVSGATGGTSGVTFYPADSWSQESTDSTMIHEGGHAYSQGLWEDDKKKKAWEQAIADDGQSPSTYSDNASTEDFSESLVMYSLSKGTDCEATAKKLYPNRYAVLDDLFGVNPATPPVKVTPPVLTKLSSTTKMPATPSVPEPGFFGGVLNFIKSIFGW